jgi:PPOX class probable F420-dependent enzyme
VANAVPSWRVRTFLGIGIRTIAPGAERCGIAVCIAMQATLQIDFPRVARTNARNRDARVAQIRQAATVSRRDQITLSETELLELLEDERIAIVSSLGPRGWPHSMPLWFVPREGEVWIWTYAKSQKVRNLERDPRATVLVETGHEYSELRGVMIEAEAELHRDRETVLGFAEELTLRYAEGISTVEGDAKAALEAQAPKRVAIRFKPVRVASWDHRKLGGTY